MTILSTYLTTNLIAGIVFFLLLRIIRIQSLILKARNLCDAYNDYNIIAPNNHPQSAYMWFMPQLPSIRRMALSPRKVDLESWIEPDDLKRMMECIKRIEEQEQEIKYSI